MKVFKLEDGSKGVSNFASGIADCVADIPCNAFCSVFCGFDLTCEAELVSTSRAGGRLSKIG